MAGTTFGGRNWIQRYGWGRILGVVVGLLGIWQIIAPYVLGFAGEQTAMWNAIICGVLLFVFAALGFYGMGHWSPTSVRIFDGLAALTGLWLVISPFVLQYQTVVTAFWNAIIIGLFSFVCAGFAASKYTSSA